MHRRVMHNNDIRIVGLSIDSTNGTEPAWRFVSGSQTRGAILSATGSMQLKKSNAETSNYIFYPFDKPANVTAINVNTALCDVSVIEIKKVSGVWIRQRSSGWMLASDTPDHTYALATDTEAIYIICRQAGVDAGVVTDDMVNNIKCEWS